MIASLNGNLVLQDGEQWVVDVSGVGYAVHVSGSLLGALPAAAEGRRKVALIVYTDVKENDISLWGFSSVLEKQVFLLLKKVSGVGSKTAMAIVSSVGPEPLLQRIGAADITGLTKVPGVGKKTAERIIVELREQVGMIAQGFSGIPEKGSARGSNSSLSEPSPVVDAELALEKLGFSYDRAKRAVQEAAEPYLAGGTLAKLSAGDLVQQALSKL